MKTLDVLCWDKAHGATQFQLIITSGKLPVTMAGEHTAIKGILGPSDAFRNRKGKVKAAADPSTEKRCTENDGENSVEEDTNEEEKLRVSKRKKKASEKDSKNELLMQLAQTLDELQKKVEKLSKKRRGLIAMLS